MWKSILNYIRRQLPQDYQRAVPVRTNITRLFRNAPQLILISRLLSLQKDKNSFRVAIYGVADGSEAVSLFVALDPDRTQLEVQIDGFDICEEYLRDARNFTFTQKHFQADTCTAFHWESYFHKLDKQRYQLKPLYWKAFCFSYGDVTKAQNSSEYNLVICQNTLISIPDEQISVAIANLATLVKPGGILAVGGGPLGRVPQLTLQHGFVPILEDVEDIHEAWTVQRRFYENSHRPYWALEPFDANHREGAVRYCTVFQKPAILASR